MMMVTRRYDDEENGKKFLSKIFSSSLPLWFIHPAPLLKCARLHLLWLLSGRYHHYHHHQHHHHSSTNITTPSKSPPPHSHHHHRLITTIPIIITTIMTIVIITIVIITPTASLDCQRVEFQLPTIDLTSSPRRPRWR